MPPVTLSARLLREQVETKAFAYGVAPVICTLLGEYVVEVLRQARQQPGQASHNSSHHASYATRPSVRSKLVHQTAVGN